jgi:hypothetical protein
MSAFWKSRRVPPGTAFAVVSTGVAMRPLLDAPDPPLAPVLPEDEGREPVEPPEESPLLPPSSSSSPQPMRPRAAALSPMPLAA